MLILYWRAIRAGPQLSWLSVTTCRLISMWRAQARLPRQSKLGDVFARCWMPCLSTNNDPTQQKRWYLTRNSLQVVAPQLMRQLAATTTHFITKCCHNDQSPTPEIKHYFLNKRPEKRFRAKAEHNFPIFVFSVGGHWEWEMLCSANHNVRDVLCNYEKC